MELTTSLSTSRLEGHDEAATAHPQQRRDFVAISAPSRDRTAEAAAYKFHEGDLSTALSSGVVLGLLDMTLNVSLAAVVFEAKAEYTMMGFDANNLACLLACLVIVGFAKCPCYVGCPNSVAAVVFAPMVAGLVADLNDERDRIIPTVIWSIVLCTALVGAVFAIIGTFKLTKLVQIFPQSVMNGFLATIGAHLFKSSLKVASGSLHLEKVWMVSPELLDFEFWSFFWPVPPLAISLFLIQRNMKVSPVVLWSTFLILPLLIFYVIAFSFGQGTSDLRENGWLLQEMKATQFYEMWSFGFQVDKVHWPTVWNSVLKVVPLIPVVVVDVLVGFAATRKAAEYDPEYDDDSFLTGGLFGLQATLCCPLATNSTKLSLLNVQVAGCKTRIPTLICGIFCGFIFFAPPIIVPLFPRFYLAFLLQFNALGFLVKNLYDSRHHLTKSEYVVPWVMVYADIQAQLAGAVITGFMLASGVFAAKYAQLGVVKSLGSGQHARNLAARHVRTQSEEAVLCNISDNLFVVKLQNYLFFGSLMQIETMVNELLEHPKTKFYHCRIIIDWGLVDGMDASVPSVIAVAIRKLKAADFEIIFTGMEASLAAKMESEGAMKNVLHSFERLEDGVAFVEEELLNQCAALRQAWFRIHLAGSAALDAHNMAVACFTENILTYMLGDRAAPDICAGAVHRRVEAGEVVCHAGKRCTSAFVVQQGVLEKLGAQEKLEAILHRGACFNEWALLLGDQAMAASSIVAKGPAVVLEITHDLIKRVTEKDPKQLQKLQKVVLLQALAAGLAPGAGQEESNMNAVSFYCEDARALSSTSFAAKSFTSKSFTAKSFNSNTTRTSIKKTQKFNIVDALKSTAYGLSSDALKSSFDSLKDGSVITVQSILKSTQQFSEEDVKLLVADADLAQRGSLSWADYQLAVMFVHEP